MPVWHEALKSQREHDQIVMLGVIQEQHAERCRLFAQWKQFDWPIVQDPINKLNLAAVPIMVDIDEHGVTRAVNPSLDAVRKSLVAKANGTPTSAPRLSPKEPSLSELEQVAKRENSYAEWQALGDAAVLWGEKKDKARRAIQAYEKARDLAPKRPAIHFRLGVAHRMLYDSRPEPTPTNADRPTSILDADLPDLADVTVPHNHFQIAVDCWGKALDLNPNQYIYRRRIQQYGPRLIKPYPFYHWVKQAREEITDRGETPIQLRVEPSGAEIASPSGRAPGGPQDSVAPDPDGKINRDNKNLVASEAAVVPAMVRPGETVRVHVTFKPQSHALWNNESDPLLFWVELPAGWKADRNGLKSPIPASAESSERRSFDFELTIPRSQSTSTTLTAYALYYVCESARGTCLFLRNDVEIPIRIKGE